jgi:hypothetical protein
MLFLYTKDTRACVCCICFGIPDAVGLLHTASDVTSVHCVSVIKYELMKYECCGV